MNSRLNKSRLKLALRGGKSALLAALVTAAVATLGGCGTLADWRDENKGIQMEALKTAPGLKVSLFATNLPKAREMAMSPSGTLFVGSNAGKFTR